MTVDRFVVLPLPCTTSAHPELEGLGFGEVCLKAVGPGASAKDCEDVHVCLHRSRA